MKTKTEYNPEKDVEFFEGYGQMAKVEKNTFVILFPSDATHAGYSSKIMKMWLK